MVATPDPERRRLRRRRRELSRAHRLLLGGEPSAADLADDRPLREVAAQLADSERHAEWLAAAGEADVGMLAGSAVAEERIPEGTVSSDERAIAGADGFLFVNRGSNSTLRQFRGLAQLSAEALAEWEEAVDLRASGAASLGAALALLIVPDKLAAVPRPFSEPLPTSGPRPVQQLREALPGSFLYPAEGLRAAAEGGEVAYRTDSHLSLHGARVVYAAAMEGLGFAPEPAALAAEPREVFRSSALGRSFSPPLYDVQEVMDPSPRAAVESNETEVGLHRGIVRVSRNPDAPLRRKLVVIGDSYCFPWRSGQLGCLLERSFAETHFLWTAMGWDRAYLEAVRPDCILLESAERFLIRPPEPETMIEPRGVRVIQRPLEEPGQPGAIDLAATSGAIASRLSGYRSRIDTTIAAGDEMYTGDLAGYLSVTHSAVAQIAHAMAACGRTSCERILDLPCGHGRVLRGLEAAFPEAELTACDINRDGVDFCAARFGAHGVYSDPDPARIELDGLFDLIWVGSLLTHLDSDRCLAFLELLRAHLAPGGLLLFSSHGRNAVKRWRRDDERAGAIAADFREHGFGYRDHPGVEGYGTSAFTAAWIAAQLSACEDLMLVGFVERGLADHQDLTVLLKMDVHHPQNELLLA
jgi:SAM-dependent methyltransferase